MKRRIFWILILFSVNSVFSQTIQLNSLSPASFCSSGKDTFKFSINYNNIPANSNIVFYQSSNPAFNPYAGQGDSIGFINVGSNTSGGGGQVTTTCPEILGIFIDACDQGGVLREVDNEYMVITSGNTGFNVSDLKIQLPNTSINVSGCPFLTPSAATMTQLRNGTCDATTLIAAGQVDFIPANAIVIIFTGRGALYNYNFSSYCSSGQPIYILQNSCSPGTANFVNNAPSACSGGPVYRSTTITVGACSDRLTYAPCTLPPFNSGNPNADDGNYVIHLPNTDTSSITNGGIRNNAADKCNGLRFDSISGATIIKYPIPNDGTGNGGTATNFCNDGLHYIKAITHPNGSQPVSNTLQFQLICLDVATNVSNLSICSGNNAAINISSTDPSATFSWTVSGGAGITGASSGSGNTINQTLNYNGTTKDSITYNITATHGTCIKTTSVKVVVNKCSNNSCDTWLNLNDTPSGISCGDLDIIGDKVTVECLFNKYPTVNSPHLVSKHQVASAVNYAIGPLNAEITTTNNGYVLLQAPCPPDPNKTYHVAMVYDGSTFKYYRNGNLVASTNCSGNLINNDILLTIGQINQATGPDYEQFKGYMNEVRIWNIARTQADIQANMTSSLNNPTTISGLKGYYIFDNLQNKQGNSAFNGVIIGTAQINKTNPQCSISPLNITPINLGNDTTYCGPFSKVLSTGNAATVWSTGVTASSITVSSPGTYYATINSACGAVTDTIKLFQSSGINFDFGAPTTSVCVGGNISLDASTAYDSYLWSTGAVTNAITISSPGKYWVDVFKNGCKGTDTIQVIQITKEPKPNLGPDKSVCSPVSQTLTTGNINTTWYQTNTSNQVGTGANFTATQFGTFIAKVSNSCGDVFDTIVITQTNTQAPINLGNDTTYCGPFSRVLSTGNAATVWSTGVTAASITVTTPGTYTATINVGCGVASDAITISQSSGISFDFGSNTTSVCTGSNISISAGNTFDSYQWSTGAVTNTITITQPGIYWVDVFKNGCKASDTIRVIQISKEPKPNLGRDTSYCGTFSQTLSTGNAQTEWFRNNVPVTTAASISINQSGTYIARISNSCGAVADTIIISSGNALSVNLGRDTAICTGASITLNASTAGTGITYNWNTGVQTPTISVSQFGIYVVEVSNGLCKVSDSINVDVLTKPTISSLGNDTSFCGNFSYTLFTGDATTIWSTGTVGPSAIVTQPGRVIAENRNQCGSASDTVFIQQFALPLINLGKDTTICDSIILSVGNGNFLSVLWNTSETSNSIVANTEGVFSVSVSNANCTNTDSIRIRKECFYEVYIPTAFSPNADNFNDIYVPLSNIKGIQVINFIIFNRWGEKVYEAENFAPNDSTKGWNGTYKGENCPVDHYVYYYSVKLPDDKVKFYKGTFALLR